MTKWIDFPAKHQFAFDAADVKKHWARLHVCDREPVPEHPKVIAAWAHYHNGDFRLAYDAGLECGLKGQTVANKAAYVYANYLERNEKSRQDLFLEVAERAAALAKAHPEIVSAHYAYAYAMGRYSQTISVAKALAQGVGSKVKATLETVVRLEPRHADALVALGLFHAEIIDKVGPLIGNMTFGAKRDSSLKLFQQSLLLAPRSPIAIVEYANALMMLDGDRRTDEVTQLYKKAAAIEPMDAKEYLEVRLAQEGLSD